MTHKLRTAVLGVAVAVTVTTVATMAIALHDGPQRSAATDAFPSESRTSTAPTTDAPTTSAPDPTPTSSTPSTSTTTQAQPPEHPARQARRPAAFPGIYPETSWEELDRAQRAVDNGHQPGRLDPEQVAREYLRHVGVSDASVIGVRAKDDDALVAYEAYGNRGAVHLVRFGRQIYVVTSSTTDRIERLHAHRHGRQLDVEVASALPGPVLISVGPLRSEPHINQRTFGVPSTPLRLSLQLPDASTPVVVQVKHFAAEGEFGLAQMRVDGSAEDSSTDQLSAESALRIDGLGPVMIGMALDEAARAAGVPMTRHTGPHCDGLSPESLPGVSFVRRHESEGIDLIFVDGGPTRTLSGIGIGSTIEEVVRTYGERIEFGPPRGDEPRWLLFRAVAPELERYGLRFDLGGGKVRAMVAGIDVLADEFCA